MKIVIAQLNPVVGDVEGNIDKIFSVLERTKDQQPDLLVFSELFLVGYPPRDLLERRWFIEKAQAAIETIKDHSKHYPATGILFGAPIPTAKDTGTGLYNAALLVYQGKLIFTQHKSLLPNYDVFDEARYFDTAAEVQVVEFKGEQLGVSICEDAWSDPELKLKRNYDHDPIETLIDKGAKVLINISASPFTVGKENVRFDLIRRHVEKHKVPFIYVNQVGGNDELIFDGRSMCLDARSNLVTVLAGFEEQTQLIELGAAGSRQQLDAEEPIESMYKALVLGLRDYVRKCGFSKVVLGLSGGIDSAVVCCLAVAALGRENVLGVTMPSQYSSEGSVDDSRKLAENLGIEFKQIPIAPIYQAYIKTMTDHFAGQEQDTTEENFQARIRGNILMALSNKFGSLLLSTGNKSELAVGYCTLYGDMSGGLSVISDVPKTMVYEIAHFINRDAEVIPNDTITKPPSAELKPGQVDQDTLPPYEDLDRILRYYIDEGWSVQEIINQGFAPDVVHWIVRTVDRNEYKRRQAAPGLKVTTKAFGVGRRIPIAMRIKV